MKDAYSELKDAIPSLVGKRVSRFNLIEQAAECIQQNQIYGSSKEVSTEKQCGHYLNNNLSSKIPHI